MSAKECKVGCDACAGTGIVVVKGGPRGENGKTPFAAFWWGYNPNIGCYGVRRQEFNADLEALQERHAGVRIAVTDDEAKVMVRP